MCFLKCGFKSKQEALLALENPVQQRETKGPKTGSHLLLQGHLTTPAHQREGKTSWKGEELRPGSSLAMDTGTGRSWVAQEAEGKYV